MSKQLSFVDNDNQSYDAVIDSMLESLSYSELEALLNPQSFDSFFNNSPLFQSLLREYHSSYTKAKKLAESNTSTELELIDLLDERDVKLIDLKHNEKKLQKLLLKQSEELERFQIESISKSLDLEKRNIHLQSQSLLMNYKQINKLTDLENFIIDYKTSRKLFHEYELKIEKLLNKKDDVQILTDSNINNKV